MKGLEQLISKGVELLTALTTLTNQTVSNTTARELRNIEEDRRRAERDQIQLETDKIRLEQQKVELEKDRVRLEQEKKDLASGKSSRY